MIIKWQSNNNPDRQQVGSDSVIQEYFNKYCLHI